MVSLTDFINPNFQNDPSFIQGIAMLGGDDPEKALSDHMKLQSDMASQAAQRRLADSQVQENTAKTQQQNMLSKAVAMTANMDAQQTYRVLAPLLGAELAYKVADSKDKASDFGKTEMHQIEVQNPQTGEKTPMMVDKFGNPVSPQNQQNQTPTPEVSTGLQNQDTSATGAEIQPTASNKPKYSLYDRAAEITGLGAGAERIFGDDPTGLTTPKELLRKTEEYNLGLNRLSSLLVNNPNFSEKERASIAKTIDLSPHFLTSPSALQAKVMGTAENLSQTRNDYNATSENKSLTYQQRNNARAKANSIQQMLDEIDAPLDKKKASQIFLNPDEKKGDTPTIQSEQIQQAKQNGYSDKEIADHLSSLGYEQQINNARKGGSTYADIVNKFAGGETGFINRVKQGAGGGVLAIEQMLHPHDPIISGAVDVYNQKVGNAGFGAKTLSFASNPVNVISALIPGGLMAKGAMMGAGAEIGTPQEVQQGKEFSPLQKAKDTAVQTALGAVTFPIIDAGGRMLIAPVKKLVTKSGELASKGITKAKDIIGSTESPLSDAGAMQSASKGMQGLVADPEKTLAEMNDPRHTDIPTLTPAQQSGEPSFTGLQNEIASENPVVQAEIEKRNAESLNTIKQQAVDIGKNIPATHAMDYLQGLKNKAILTAKDATDKLSTDKSPAELGIAVDTNMEHAYSIAKGVGDAKYAKVDKEKITLPTTSLKKNISNYINGLNNTVQENEYIPSSIDKYLGSTLTPKVKTFNTPDGDLLDLSSFKTPDKPNGLLQKKEPASTFSTFRGLLLQDARNARAGLTPHPQVADHAEKIAQIISDTLEQESSKISGTRGKNLRDANAYYADFKNVFGQDYPNKILAKKKTTADYIAPELSLERTVGTGGTTGDVATKQLLGATRFAEDAHAQEFGTPPSNETTNVVRQQIHGHLLNNFRASAVRDGQLSESSARRWLGKNQDVLQHFPEIQSGISDAITAAKKAKILGGQVDEYLGAKSDREFNKILQAQNPAKMAEKLTAIVKDDHEGKALYSLKTAAMEHLLGNSGALLDKRTMDAVGHILSTSELARLTYLNKMTDRILDKGTRVGKVIDDTPNRLIEGFVRTLGAKTAKVASHFLGMGGTLQAASFGSSNAQRLLQKLGNKPQKIVNQFVLDNDLAKTLMQPIKTDAQVVKTTEELVRKIKKNKDLISNPVIMGAITEYEQAKLHGGYKKQQSAPPSHNPAPQSSLFPTLQQDEGLRHTAYMDTTGNRTVGEGFNMDSGIAKTVWKRAGINTPFNDVYHGKSSISDDEAKSLSQISENIAEEDARHVFPKFDKLSENRQQAVLNLSYQLGGNKLAEFKKFRSAMQDGQYTLAARELAKSEWYSQTQKSRSHRIIRQIMYG